MCASKFRSLVVPLVLEHIRVLIPQLGITRQLQKGRPQIAFRASNIATRSGQTPPHGDQERCIRIRGQPAGEETIRLAPLSVGNGETRQVTQ